MTTKTIWKFLIPSDTNMHDMKSKLYADFISMTANMNNKLF